MKCIVEYDVNLTAKTRGRRQKRGRSIHLVLESGIKADTSRPLQFNPSMQQILRKYQYTLSANCKEVLSRGSQICLIDFIIALKILVNTLFVPSQVKAMN